MNLCQDCQKAIHDSDQLCASCECRRVQEQEYEEIFWEFHVPEADYLFIERKIRYL